MPRNSFHSLHFGDIPHQGALNTSRINACLIEIETNSENTVPNFFMVGLPHNAVKESRERVATAIKNSGFVYSNKLKRFFPVTTP